MPIPVLLNAKAGSAARARAALRADQRFSVREVLPRDIAVVVREQADLGTRRLLVCGGDGTLSAAIGAAAGTSLQIAIFPGGTLNHFAHALGIPVDDPASALDIAATGTLRSVDLGSVNGHFILNTSAVGAYPEFVRRRDDLEQRRRLNYSLASVAAAAEVWRDRRALSVDLVTGDGKHHAFEAPLLFVGVHERVLAHGGLGMRRVNGVRALHILVVKERSRARMQALVAKAAVRSVEALTTEHEVESFLTQRATIVMPHASCLIAIDGELLEATSPLQYEFVTDAVKVVCG